MRIKKLINQYKIHIFFGICFFILGRMIFARYNSIFIRVDKNYIPSFFLIVFIIISWILLWYKWYMDRNYSNRNTLIKKFINNNPKIKQGLLKTIEVYNNIYTNRIIDIDTYLVRFKIYKIIQSIGGNFRNSYFIFTRSMKNRAYKDITFIGIYNIIYIYISYIKLCHDCNIFHIVNDKKNNKILG